MNDNNRSNWKWTAIMTLVLLLVLALVWYSQAGAMSLNSSIQGQTFNDLNRDGVLQDGEPGIAGVTVCASGPVTECAVSSQWNYSIENLPSGEYVVTSTIPISMTPTSPVSLTVVLTDTNATGINFGFASLTNIEPEFPSCEDLTPPGDWNSFYGDFHVPGIAGSFFGQDDVYNLGDGNAVQCGCPAGENMGWQTNWWKPVINENSPPDGWYLMTADWNLPSSPPYWYVNSQYVCSEQQQAEHVLYLPIVSKQEPIQDPVCPGGVWSEHIAPDGTIVTKFHPYGEPTIGTLFTRWGTELTFTSTETVWQSRVAHAGGNYWPLANWTELTYTIPGAVETLWGTFFLEAGPLYVLEISSSPECFTNIYHRADP